ncbi:MAG: 23S rRNA (uracil(1939)-C(5))-methyltransferase RlmD [Saccharofermentans sp.]|nr:23S rRNA (uracil(1939)-C(5))-methyltransferase RlmD [Saccharofermentans sp.]
MSANNCKAAKQCGGCSYAGCTYTKQLVKKQEYIRSLLPKSCKMEPIIPSDDEFFYRNKVHSTFKRLKNGRIICGPYEAESHRIVEIDKCLIENETAGRIIRDCASIAGRLSINIYNEVTGTGELRRVLVRVSETTGEVMVVIVIGSKYFRGKNAFIKELTKLHPEITTILISVHSKHNSMILGDTIRKETGPGYITDKVLGNTFRISPTSFFQVNRRASEKLYSTAVRLARVSAGEEVLDCYSGIGTISLAFAKFAGHVTGVENNKEAVQDAIRNKKINNIRNCDFVAEDATSYMVRRAEEGHKVDTLILDPTRLGTTPEFIEATGKLAPKKIIYVSCGPKTLARDLKLFAKQGYKAITAVPVDMFPWTEHVECVALLQKLSNTRSKEITLDVEMEDYHRIKNRTEVTPDAKE